ncbi:MAG TPA: RNA 2',3'-cyclic phosphodiesterase [Actinomycetota bacterium]|nr:RNA 2',3'-cyclic phosphodiesterase [Actinomycetota bacterium]
MGRDRSTRPGAEALRLFAAVDPSEEVLAAVSAAVQPWRERLPEGRWVRPENWHVTLKFLGRTYPRLVPTVHEACREAAASVARFDVSVAGMGVFPGPSRARVLWVGLDDPAGGMPALARALDEQLAEEFPPEKRAFTAHLTVARFNPPIPFRDHADDLAATAIEAPPFAVEELVLYRSHLSPRGARYEPLERFPLLAR